MRMRAVVLVVQALMITIDATGKMIDPPTRSNMWRFGFKTPKNYNDDRVNCGGHVVQWFDNNGKCGICGDPWNGPRDNEAGGRYATGTIVKSYTEGQTITTTIRVKSDLGGWFEFRLCPNNNSSKPVTRDCLNRHLLTRPTGSIRYYLPEGVGERHVSLVLPVGVTCTQCVLQWKWNAGNSWGCEGFNCGLGLGPQEQYYGCADVAITTKD